MSAQIQLEGLQSYLMILLPKSFLMLKSFISPAASSVRARICAVHLISLKATQHVISMIPTFQQLFPGIINLLSWGSDILQADGAESDRAVVQHLRGGVERSFLFDH